MEVSREEILEFAKMATFYLDDRLVPFDRETLRAESWLAGYEFAKQYGQKPKETRENLPFDAEEVHFPPKTTTTEPSRTTRQPFSNKTNTDYMD